MKASPLARTETWDSLAVDYDANVHPVFASYVERALEAVPSSDSEHRALDVACGPGTAALLLATRFAEVHAVDGSERMVRRCALNAEKAKRSNVIARQMDGQQLAYEDEYFDLAVCMFGLMFFPDQARGMTELLRVTRPGGRVIVSCWSEERSPTMELLGDALQALKRRFGSAIPPPVGTKGLGGPQGLRELMIRTGLVDTQLWCVQLPRAMHSPEELWDTFEASNALTLLARTRHSAADWANIRRAAVEHIGCYAHGELTYDPMAWFAIGVRKS